MNNACDENAVSVSAPDLDNGNNAEITELEAPDRAHKKHDRAYLILSFVIPAVIMFLIYLAKGIYPFGEGSVLVLDLNGQYVYFYEALRRFVYGDASILYSFSRALGGEFLGMYAYYLASPLSYIVALFPKGKMLEALLTLFVIKTGLCGLSFGWYLSKISTTINKFNIWTFSTIYALISYAVIMQHNSMWIDALIWLPLITYGIEQLIKNKKYKLFVISLALSIMSNFYIGYMTCIYVLVCYFVLYFSFGNEGNPRNEKCHFIRSLLRMALFSAIAVGISAFIILASYYSLSFGKTEFSTPDWSFTVRFGMLDIMAKLLPGTYDTVRTAGLPTIYCGVLTLMLLPFYYFSKQVKFREKLCFTIFLAFFLISFALNPLDIVWHGFQKPNWLNYRYSFMFSFLLLVMAYKAMDGIRQASKKAVFAVGAAILFMLAVLERMDFENFILDGKYLLEAGKINTYRTVWFTILMIVAYASILYFLMSSNKTRKASIAMLIVVSLEMFGNGLICLSSLDIDVSYTSYSSYNDYINDLRPITEDVMESDSSFYRIEKTIQLKLNDNMAVGMRGLSGSTSTLNKETVKLLYDMGYASKAHWSRYTGGNVVTDALFGLKYVLATKKIAPTSAIYYETQAMEEIMKALYTEYMSSDDYTAYLNPYALSLAYSVSSDINNFSFTRTINDAESDIYASPFDKINSMITAMLGESDTVKVFVPVSGIEKTDYKNCTKTMVSGHTKYTPSTSGATNASMTYSGTLNQGGFLFFYAPSEYPRETYMTVNGNSFGTFMAGDTNRIKVLGSFDKGDDIEIELTLRSTNLYLKNSENVLYRLDVDLFKEVMERLSESQYEIDFFTEDYFYGHIKTLEDNATVMTTLAYDEGWNIYVDGEKVNVKKVAGALLAFDVENAGHHRIQMVYAPKLVILGGIISAGSIVIFVMICIIEAIVKSKKRKKRSSKKNKSTDKSDEDAQRISADLPTALPKEADIPAEPPKEDVQTDLPKEDTSTEQPEVTSAEPPVESEDN